ncbi:ubiquinol-cytochrome c reductase iron-sulfur subunit [Candidatus Kryptonium thompsonii]|uniref:QcrA and Rieske domain-containing protein n=1 Tax=Candidatus Kryptonium thompsonii TaxID=1633631 RepID=UPI00070728D6|nr:ubiquinol-cytochrome c reductase iron-sulfur subunit [Candidatus Kryptonium thompsoni]CUS78132.1 menaquinol-cytochrome c reductase iron-sulfur subunit [Candidatus Kryptonium thompsoni]
MALAGQIYTWVRSLFPNVSYEGTRRVKLDEPDKIPDGVTFIDDIKTYIFREGKTFYAISAVCTHLGCTVKYVGLSKPKVVKIGGKEVEVKWEFHCPCHGSKFYGDGTNYAGPAPRPLDWVKIEVSPEDGKLVVDLGKKVSQNYKLTV